MPISGAERQQRYRQKLKENNPEKLEQLKKINLERTKSKYKKISDLIQRDQDVQREKWRKQKRNRNYEEIDQQPQKKTDKKKVCKCRYQLRKENLNLKSTVALLAKKAKCQQRTIYRYKKQIKQLVEALNKNEQEKHTQHYKENEEDKQTLYSKTEKLLAEKIPQISTPEKKFVKLILFENLVIKESLSNQYSQAMNHSERNTLKKVINNDITGKYKMKTKLNACVGLCGMLRNRKILKQKKNYLKDLNDFMERDDNSRATAGKKEFRTLHKTRKQVRYLLDTMKNLHKKYINEGGKLSYSTFTRYKPFYVLSPKIVDRNTCACVKHANLTFITKKLKQLMLINTDSLVQLLSVISCNLINRKCMCGECDDCSHKSIEFDLPRCNPTDVVTWNRWVTNKFKYFKNTVNQRREEKTTKRTVKEETTGSIETLLQTFSDQIRLFKKHHFNITHQYQMYKYCKDNLTEKEVVLHCDFSENYVCKFTEEVQAMYFGASKRQITLHTGVIYAKHQDGLKTTSFCTISPNNNHCPGAIWAHLTPVLECVKDKFPTVTTIHFYSDGPTTQYSQKKNFHMMNRISKFGFEKATWSFFEASHGKGAADGIGGATNRTLDRYVTHGQDIPDAKAAYDALVKENTSKINYFYVPDENVDLFTINLDSTTKDLIPVPNTISVHQVISTPNTEIIKFRKLSCFCGTNSAFCECFDLNEHNLKQKKKNKEREKITEHKQKVTILSDIRNTLENRSFFDIQKYSPVTFRVVDADVNFFSTHINNEKMSNITIDTIGTAKKTMEGKETDVSDINSSNIRFNHSIGKQNNETEEIKIPEKNSMQKGNETEEQIKILGNKVESFTVNDSVLVRYFQRKSWVYYIGFIESVDNKTHETYYTIRFLKTVKKPKLKFIATKIERDTVPAICIVKKVNLTFVSREYMLSDCDKVYFD